MDPFYIGAYWGSRKETSLRCGERLANCLARLAEIDDALASWFRRGASRSTARVPVEPRAASLGQLLAHGVNRRDSGGEVIEELGFSIGLWNRARPAVGIGGTVGAYPSFQSVLNNVVVDIPPPEDEALRLFELTVATAIFESIVEAWEPDWATWTTHSIRNAQGVAAQEPVVGWMTYLKTPVLGDLSGATVRPLCGGSLITIGRDVSDVRDRAVLEVRAQLASSGAFGSMS